MSTSSASVSRATPITVILVNDYDIIVRGLAAMVAPFPDRVRVVEMDVGTEPKRFAEVALFDTFAGRRHAIERARDMVSGGLVDHVIDRRVLPNPTKAIAAA